MQEDSVSTAAHVWEMWAYSEPPVQHLSQVKTPSPIRSFGSSDWQPFLSAPGNEVTSGADDGSQGISLENSAKPGHQSDPTDSLIPSSAAGDVNRNDSAIITLSSPNGSREDNKQKEGIVEPKKRRYRGPNWSGKEKNHFLVKQEKGRSLGLVGESLYQYVSKHLIGENINRTPKQCENFADTLVKKTKPNDGAGSSIPPPSIVQTTCWRRPGRCEVTVGQRMGKRKQVGVQMTKERLEETLERGQQKERAEEIHIDEVGVQMTKERLEETLERGQQKERAEEIHIDAMVTVDCQHKEQVAFHETQRKIERELHKKQREWHWEQLGKLLGTNPESQWHFKQADWHRQRAKELKRQKT